MDNGSGFEEMSESEREDVINETWYALNGGGTCDDKPIRELKAIYTALGSGQELRELVERAYISKFAEGWHCTWCKQRNTHSPNCRVAAALALPLAPKSAPGGEPDFEIIAHDILGPAEGVPCANDRVWRWTHTRIPNDVYHELARRITEALRRASLERDGK